VFDNVEKSLKFLLEVISLVSSANKMGSYKLFIVGYRSFIYIKKAKSLKLSPGEFHVLKTRGSFSGG
jgi:hypothetical protein